MEDLGKEIGVIIAAVLIGFGKDLTEWLKNKFSKKTDMFTDSLKYDILINEELDRLKYTYGFNRVAVIDYHNGSTSYDGVSFSYSSMTHERTNNADSIITRFQKIPIGPISNWLQDLDQNSAGFSMVDSDNSSLGIIQEAWGSLRVFSFKLGERISKGTLVCSFTHYKEDLDDAALIDCKATAYKIKIYLDKKK